MSEAYLFDARWLDHSRLHCDEYFLGTNGRCAEVTLEQHGGTFRLLADVRNGHGEGDAWHYERALRVELSVVHPATAKLDGRWTSWPLDESPREEGLLRDCAAWLSAELWEDDGPEATRTRGLVENVCERLGQHALACADRDAVDVARTITRDARFFTYAALLGDARGHVRQLVATCPALLSLASGLSPHVDDGATLMEGIRRGRKLDALIAETLAAASRRLCIGGTDDRMTALVRRAPSMPMRVLMWLLRAPGIDINDLYASGERRRRWFEVMAAWGLIAARIPDRGMATALGSFVSKHALAIARSHPESELTEIIDWVVRSGASVPTRRTRPESVRRAIDEWHLALQDELHLDPMTPLVRPPVARRRFPDLDIEPLLTVGELVREGATMRHCIASYAPEAVSGWVCVFRATVHGTRATVAVIRGCGGWGLMEAAGFANRALPDDSVGLLRFWAESLK